jgi:hypothetical protein
MEDREDEPAAGRQEARDGRGDRAEIVDVGKAEVAGDPFERLPRERFA